MIGFDVLFFSRNPEAFQVVPQFVRAQEGFQNHKEMAVYSPPWPLRLRQVSCSLIFQVFDRKICTCCDQSLYHLPQMAGWSVGYLERYLWQLKLVPKNPTVYHHFLAPLNGQNGPVNTVPSLSLMLNSAKPSDIGTGHIFSCPKTDWNGLVACIVPRSWRRWRRGRRWKLLKLEGAYGLLGRTSDGLEENEFFVEWLSYCSIQYYIWVLEISKNQ